MQVCNLCYRQRFINLITIKLEKGDDYDDDDYDDDSGHDINDDKNNRMMAMIMMIRITKW